VEMVEWSERVLCWLLRRMRRSYRRRPTGRRYGRYRQGRDATPTQDSRSPLSTADDDYYTSSLDCEDYSTFTPTKDEQASQVFQFMITVK